ncbi:MAG: DNA polymerase Y family protein [Acidimicrobiia bacterium]
MGTVTRTLVIWCPDWPVLALGHRSEEPAAVLVGNRVLAATAAARADGVVAGLRRRDAQARCPQLTVVERDLDREARAFEPVAAVASSFTPWVELSWPGSCAFPTRGPSRYFGGDEALVARVREAIDEAVPAQAGLARVGVADGLFAARLAARAGGAHRRGVLVEPGGTPAFLAPLPLSVLERPALVDVLGRLGLRTMGELAALPAADVLGRFGEEGRHVHRLATGLDEQPVDARPAPADLSVSSELDPPVERIDQAAFAAKSLADRLSEQLDGAGWSCLRLAVEAETEHGERLLRLWRHDGALTPGAMAERVRWQLEGWLTAAPGRQPTGGLTRLALVPDQVVPARGRQLGFWGGQTEAAARAARAAGRVAALLGPEAVRVVQRRGGRQPGELFALLAATAVDLVERADGGALPAMPEADAPWPGRLPAPSPSVLWGVGSPDDPVPGGEPVAARVLDADGAGVGVTGRGELTAPPAVLVLDGVAVPGAGATRGARPVVAWAGPWPLQERWWDLAQRRRVARLQVVLDDDSAWLLVLEEGRWWVTASYD